MKPVALFAVLAWLIWMAWARVGRRAAAAGVVALVIPLLLYSGVHASVTGTFGLTQSDGWFLYGRVGSIATCNGIKVEPAARGLCNRPARAAHEGQSFFMFNHASPAHVALGGVCAGGRAARLREGRAHEPRAGGSADCALDRCARRRNPACRPTSICSLACLGDRAVHPARRSRDRELRAALSRAGGGGDRYSGL